MEISAAAEEEEQAAAGDPGCSASDVASLRHRVDHLISKTDDLERRVSEVVQFYAGKKQDGSSRGCSASKEKDRENGNANCSGGSGGGGSKKQAADGAVCTKRMQELMRQFGTILKQISQHKWSWPFMNPVDVEELGIHDYYEVCVGILVGFIASNPSLVRPASQG